MIIKKRNKTKNYKTKDEILLRRLIADLKETELKAKTNPLKQFEADAIKRCIFALLEVYGYESEEG